MPRISPILVLAVCLCLAPATPWATAAEKALVSTPASEVWLIDTRCARGCGDLEAGLAQIRYWRLDPSCNCGQWQASDALAFHASATPGIPTTVLVHGYGTDADWAVRHGNSFRSLIEQQACGRPFRLIVWSWPADREPGRLRADIQSKFCRSDAEAYYLARVLPQLPKGTPLGLVAFSMGCQVMSGALELLAGGAVGGRSLPPGEFAVWNNGGLPPIRVMLLAPAMDFDALSRCCSRSLATLQVQRMLVTVNDTDRVLKWYSRLYGPHGPPALGYVGPPDTVGGKLDVVEVSCEVGRKHDFDRYEACSAVYGRLAWYTFLCDVEHLSSALMHRATEKVRCHDK